MNVSFTEKQKQYIAAQLSSGDYQNASEVIREAMRLHEMYRNKVLEELRTEIAKGLDDPSSERNIRDIVKDKNKAYKPEGVKPVPNTGFPARKTRTWNIYSIIPSGNSALIRLSPMSVGLRRYL